MSDTMRDSTWKLVPVEPTTAMINAGQCGCMDNDVTVSIYRAMLDASPDAKPAPPVPASVQEILHLLSPYVRACMNSVVMSPQSVEQCEAAFKPLEAALTALVEKNHELQFSLDGVNAMRRPLTEDVILKFWQAIPTDAEDRDLYEFARAIEKAHGIEPEQGGNHG